MTVSEQIVDFGQRLRFEDIPEDVVTTAKLHLLDSLGIALASTRTNYGSAVFEAAQRLGGGKEATVIGWGFQMPATSAALVNGTLIHGLDFDDTHIESIVHASAPIAATVLAVGQREHSTGKEVLTAYILGKEIAIRLGLVAEGKFHDRGYHPTSVCGTFGTSLAAGKLSKLSTEQANDAIGLSGSMASGILQTHGSWMKRFHPGWAAHCGIIAAELGRCGFKGPREVFEGPMGLYASHLGSIPSDWSRLAEGLGTRWDAKDTALKPYPCCHFTHAFIDCAANIRGNPKFDISQIDTIECRITDRLVPILFEPRESKIRPQTAYDALFSVPYVVACMLVNGRVDLSTFYDEPYDDPQVLAVAEKIVWQEDPHSTYPKSFPGEVTIILKNGTKINDRIDINRGGPQNPMIEKEIEEKYLKNAARVMDLSQGMEAMKSVKEIESCDDVNKMIDCFVVRR